MGAQNNHLNEHIKRIFKSLNKKTECKLTTLSYPEAWCLSIFCIALWLIILIVTIFVLWRTHLEESIIVRPRVKIANRNPWYDKMYLFFISLLYLDLYVLGDDASISQWSFMQTKYLCVLIHIWIKGEVGAVKPV